MSTPPISRYPVPKLEDLPDDIRARILQVQEKAGFIPNVFLTLAHRPEECRAFLACCNDGLREGVGSLPADDRGDKPLDQEIAALRSPCLLCR